MFDWFRKKKKAEAPAIEVMEETVALDEPAPAVSETAEQSSAADEPEPVAAEPEASVTEEDAAPIAVNDEADSALEPAADDAAEMTVITGECEGEESEPEAKESVDGDSESVEDDGSAEDKKGLFARFKDRLSLTRSRIAGRIETLLSSVRTIDDDVLDELEELLITADMGVQTTSDLLFKIRGQVASRELSDATALKAALKNRILEMVDLPCPEPPKTKPMVLMVVGINGVGKTTSIAKLTKRFIGEGQKVLLAAGDTFRSAAVDQLGIWAERLGADIVSQPTGADAASVVFDALNAAQARKADVVIIDTAGRLHTKANLMDELKKIRRVAGKALPGAPHHTILVLDGNTGQNAMSQAKTFHEAIGVDSIIITKLDGTAKGGVIVSIANELKIPIAFVGLGESFDDLQPFDAEAFTEAIISG